MLDPQGFDAGKKITGRKRHILVDTLGLLLSVAVHPANIQDRDGVALVLDRRTRRLFPFIERIYGDGGYQGPKAAKAAAKTGYWTIEIVERSSTAVGFEVLPKRWIVERTFAWLSRFRRLARDFERYARTVAAFIHLAMIRIMLKRLVASSSSLIGTSRMGSKAGSLAGSNAPSSLNFSSRRPSARSRPVASNGRSGRLECITSRRASILRPLAG